MDSTVHAIAIRTASVNSLSTPSIGSSLLLLRHGKYEGRTPGHLSWTSPYGGAAANGRQDMSWRVCSAAADELRQLYEKGNERAT